MPDGWKPVCKISNWYRLTKLAQTNKYMKLMYYADEGTPSRIGYG